MKLLDATALKEYAHVLKESSSTVAKNLAGDAAICLVFASTYKLVDTTACKLGGLHCRILSANHFLDTIALTTLFTFACQISRPAFSLLGYTFQKVAGVEIQKSEGYEFPILALPFVL